MSLGEAWLRLEARAAPEILACFALCAQAGGLQDVQKSPDQPRATVISWRSAVCLSFTLRSHEAPGRRVSHSLKDPQMEEIILSD